MKNNTAPQTLSEPSLDNLKELLSECKTIISDHSTEDARRYEDGDDESDASEGTTRRNELDAATSYLSRIIQGLMEWAPVLELDLKHADAFQYSETRPATVAFQVSDPARSYVQLVREKYVKAEHRLVERLGEANWQRHVRIRAEDATIPEKSENVVASLLGQAFSVVQPLSLFYDSGIVTSVAAEIEDAATTASETSFLSSNPENYQNAVRVPPLPAEASAGRLFKCDICQLMQFRIKTRADWK